jgi:hypothetical protein
MSITSSSRSASASAAGDFQTLASVAALSASRDC